VQRIEHLLPKARPLGITLPPALFALADEVIE